jgi:hypothetical protein
MIDKGRGSMRGGQNNGNSKLTEEDVRWIKHLGGSHAKIAKCFGVTETAIQKIKSGQTWCHV